MKLLRATAAAFFLYASCHATSGLAEEWAEEALLHDGRIVEVQREVHYRFGSGDLSQALRRWPTQYSLRAKNPDTGESVRWDGENGWNPVLLDFHGRRAHLVIVANLAGRDMKAFGCPEIPYVFLRSDAGGRWTQVSPAQWPPRLLQTNLSPFYSSFMAQKGRLERRDVLVSIRGAEQSSSGFVGSLIPTTFAAWQSRYKNQWRNRPARGCEHTIPSNKDPGHPQEAGQPAATVVLEILETMIYDPLWVMGSKDWSEISWNPEQAKRCAALTRLVGTDTDRPELIGWLVFTKDETRSRKARYPGTMYCDDKAIWMVQYHLPPDTAYTFITKFSHAGELLYRIKFEKPEVPRPGYLGGLLQSKLREEGGYLYGEWWNTNQSGHDRQVSRMMKVRLKEPG